MFESVTISPIVTSCVVIPVSGSPFWALGWVGLAHAVVRLGAEGLPFGYSWRSQVNGLPAVCAAYGMFE